MKYNNWAYVKMFLICCIPFLAGCAALEVLDAFFGGGADGDPSTPDGSDPSGQTSDVLHSLGGPFATAGAALGGLKALYWWARRKSDLKDTVTALESAKKKIPEDQMEAFWEVVDKKMPSRTKKIIKVIRKKI